MKILLVDDHAIFRQGLKQILETAIDVCETGEAGNAADAMRLVRNEDWDLAILDISLPDRNGIELLKLIKTERPRLPVLMLSMYAEDQYAVRALRGGAGGYLTKESAPEELAAAVRKLVAGGRYITASLAERLAMAIDDHGDRPLHELLSDREYQVLLRIASGKTASEIAVEMSISVKTVSTYRSRILEKMGMKHNAELTHYAVRNGLVG
ncbi:MAG: response regulator transcription factor [Chromatiales bacterium]|jgi:DNA-binding NarL/FixJ family response regulator|nr:response regulator transcription factor [Chromatiales bacterium]MDX9767066.1 response regulator transcription factor [Ectothiorhodospiraceae bacterium]